MTVTRFLDLPLTERDRAWEGAAAERRVRAWAGAQQQPNARYRDAHIWYDHESADNFTAYKLLVADIVDGRLMAVPRAVMAAAAIMQGSRGGIALPHNDIGRVKAHLARYYRKMSDTPPWER